VIALGAGWAVRASGWLRRNGRKVQLVGGGLLLVVGLLLVSGLWGDIISWLRMTVVSNSTVPL
jgi:cytochrome c-type biogenesis protein